MNPSNQADGTYSLLTDDKEVGVRASLLTTSGQDLPIPRQSNSE